MIEGEVKTDALVEPLGFKTSLNRASTGRFEVGVRNRVSIYITDGIALIAKL